LETSHAARARFDGRDFLSNDKARSWRSLTPTDAL
jgi:hypothetical protein